MGEATDSRPWRSGKRARSAWTAAAVAGGSILYVVIQLFEVCKRYAMPELVGWMLLLGLLLGFGTDWVLVAAGA